MLGTYIAVAVSWGSTLIAFAVCVRSFEGRAFDVSALRVGVAAVGWGLLWPLPLALGMWRRLLR